MNPSVVLVFALAAAVVALPQPPPPDSPDVPEECRPKPPEPGKEMVKCCEMPKLLMKKSKEVFSECHKKVMEEHPDAAPPHHPPPPPPPSGAAPPPPPPPSPGAHEGFKVFITCMDECFFNQSGLMTSDMKLDAAAINKMAQETMEANTAWKPIIEEAIKTCVEKANAVPDEEGCKTGPHEFNKCLMREMYMKCPSGIWQDNDECKAEKELMEKCPNILPRPPHPPHPKKEE